MDDSGSGGGDFGVVLWVLVFLGAWWGIALFLWRVWWPRRRMKRHERRRREREREMEIERGKSQ